MSSPEEIEADMRIKNFEKVMEVALAIFGERYSRDALASMPYKDLLFMLDEYDRTHPQIENPVDELNKTVENQRNGEFKSFSEVWGKNGIKN